MAQSTKQLTTKNVSAMMTRFETSARRIEKEFERQLKAIDHARSNVQREARKQIEQIRREQRGFLTRIRKAARPAVTSSKSRSSARKTAARRVQSGKPAARGSSSRRTTGTRAA